MLPALAWERPSRAVWEQPGPRWGTVRLGQESQAVGAQSGGCPRPPLSPEGSPLMALVTSWTHRRISDQPLWRDGASRGHGAPAGPTLFHAAAPQSQRPRLRPHQCLFLGPGTTGPQLALWWPQRTSPAGQQDHRPRRGARAGGCAQGTGLPVSVGWW